MNALNPAVTATLSRSAELYEKAKQIMPGGVSRNTVLRKPHPIYAAYGKGCYVTDIEGVERIDFANNMAALIHGHAHPAVVEATMEQLKKGTAFTTATEQEIAYAEHMVNRSPAFDMIRFVNSGTEAVMSCLKASRAFTGKSKIAKVEGAYHGLYDYAEVSQTANPSNWGSPIEPTSVPVAQGTPAAALNDVVVIPFNDIEKALAILDKHASKLACVLIDLVPHRVGLSPANQDFIRALRKWTTDNSALLVFDEVITFRFQYSGSQELYDVTPDLTAMGKMIGGGFPVGALAGRREVMNVMNPLQDKVPFPHSGTFSANPMTMVAGLKSMELFDRQAVEKLNALADKAKVQIGEAITLADVPACVSGSGSMFRVHLKPEVPTAYRQAYIGADEKRLLAILLNHLFDNGIMMINTCSFTLSTVMTEKEIGILADAMLGGLEKVRENL